MSLFKARDFWSTMVEGEGGNEEECIAGCMIIANIDNATPAADKIIIGGFSGTVRVFCPQSHRTEEGEEVSGYRADHVLLETTLNYPIIQVAAGKFVSNSDLLHLCVLHADRMAVYTVSVTAGQTGHGHHTRLTVAYQHKFQRKAYSLTTGSFGGVKGKDYIAVLSLDGCITVYEQESYTFHSFLPGFLLPGPMAYVPKSDGLVTVSSDWCLQCYKYQAVASATDNEKENAANSGRGKRLSPEWSQQLGEEALDIVVMAPSEGPTNILVLTFRSFCCFKESGVLKFVKKLDYNPSSFSAFGVDNAVHICIGTHTGSLLIYRETELKWAAQLPFAPVALARADFTGIKGALVFLGEAGQVQVSYLGTDPSLFVAPPTETREINYDQTDKELAQLHKIIKASTKETGTLVGVNRGESDLHVSGSVGTKLEKWPGETRVQDPDDSGVPAVPVVVRLMAHVPLNCVRVHICVEKPLAVTQDTFVLRTVCDTSQIMVKVYLAEAYIPTSLKITIIASYITHNGIPRIVTSHMEVPLRLVVKASTPNKEADHKITIATNKPAVNLPELFPDFGLDGSVTTALGLQYYGGPDVTILSSRTTNRYRLQSDSLAALWIVLSEVISRLKSYWGHSSRRDGEDLQLGVASAVPIHELFSEIDAHFMRRKKHQDLQAQLVQRATQFRAVQRRLLTKFKDKTPSPLTNLDNLLEGTYKQILQITDVINDNLKGLEEDGCILSCVVQLILELVRLQTEMTDHEYSLLVAGVSPIIHANMEQGWEETTDASVTFLLRTVMGRGTRDAASTPELTIPSDTIKLKKHLGLFFDKILKGGVELSLGSPPKSNDVDTHKDTHSGDEEELVESPDVEKLSLQAKKEEDPTTVPLGSRLGEDRARSARIRSARLTSARLTSARKASGQRATDNSGTDLTNAVTDSEMVPSETPVPPPEDSYSMQNSDIVSEEPDGLVQDDPISPVLEDPDGLVSDDPISTELEDPIIAASGEPVSTSALIHQDSTDGQLEMSVTEENDSSSLTEERDDITDLPPDEQSFFKTSKPLNKDLETLKKQTSKDNVIESPSDLFVADDADDAW